MNLRAVLWLLGRVCLILAGFLLVPVCVALYYGETDGALACGLSALVSAVVGGGLA